MNAQPKITVKGVSLPFVPTETEAPRTYGKTPAELEAQTRIATKAIGRSSPALAAIRAKVKKQVFAALAKGPKCRSEIGQECGISKEQAGVLLRELMNEGKVLHHRKSWKSPIMWSVRGGVAQ